MRDFVKERFDICTSCPYNENLECLICGCNLPYKTSKPEESCPLSPGSKWGPYVETSYFIVETTEAAPGITPTPSPAPQPCRTCTKHR